MKKPSVLTYFKLEWKALTIVTIFGLIYNIGLLAGPYFEGQLAQSVVDYAKQKISFDAIVKLVVFYLLTIILVQSARFLKRNYVRVFANNTNKRFKQAIYHTIVYSPLQNIEKEGTGSILTKAIVDADDCSEGMRKFTTELFDTCVALCAYVGLLMYYDVKLTLLCLIFVPISYLLAEKMKGLVQRENMHLKQVTAQLNEETLDRANNALMYRVYGRSQARTQAYEAILDQYEKASLNANIPFMACPPLYETIALLGVFPLLYFGAKNVLSNTWNIASFTTYFACFIKLAVKSSKSAKLFNAVHKAQVSWKRIYPYLQEDKSPTSSKEPIDSLQVQDLSFHYPHANYLVTHLSFQLSKGQMLGITGKVACGKSTLGKLFIEDLPYTGKISIGKEHVTYLGHDLQLFNASIYDNIALGEDIDVIPYLKMVCMDQEVAAMEQGIFTKLGNEGVRLSKGQAQRIALARTLAHAKELLVLDDPFSALDVRTERQVFQALRKWQKEKIILLISHRLMMFDQVDQVLFLEQQKGIVATHTQLMKTSSDYRDLVKNKGEKDACVHM